MKDLPSDGLSWRGMLEGIPRAIDNLRELTDSDGKPPIFTFLLRVDYQIKRMYGAYNHVLFANNDFLHDLEGSGHELGWHPHLWRYDEDKRFWYQCFHDEDWQAQMLREAYAAYQDVLPGRAETVRMGWTYHNNSTFATLDRLGVEVEISGMPGLKIDPRKKQARLTNFFDWSITPDKPFYPSTVDYRRAVREGEDCYSLLEAPNFRSRSIFWSMFSGLVLAKKMKDMRQIRYSMSNPAYISTITSKPFLFKPMLAQIKRNLIIDNNVLYITLLHPDELIANVHPIYSLENMQENIRSILELADSMSASVKYITAQQIKGILGVS